MAKKAAPTAKQIQNQVFSTIAANGGNTSYSSSVSNSGEMSTSVQKTGAQGGTRNVTTISQQGDPGFSLGQESEVITNMRKMMGL